ncbi:MAG: hypothetical protein AAF557_12305 [Pseudomonadota bacterium]
MILRKFIGWTILLGALMLGYAGFPVHAETEENRIALSQSSTAPAQLRLDHWPPAGWMVQQFDSLVEVKFPQVARTVDLPRGLIGRLGRRVAALDSELRGGDLYIRLTLDCACSVAVTSEGTEAVLIDVVDPNAALATADTQPAPQTAPLPSIKPGAELAVDTPDVMSNGRLNVEEAQQHLMEQLLRAADAGMVDLRPDPSDVQLEKDEEVAQTNGSATNSSQPDPLPDTQADPSASKTAAAQPKAPLIKAQAETHVSEVALTRPVPACFPDDALSFPDTDPGVPYSNLASELHAALIGEFDTVNEDAAIRLAQLNLSVGLSVETVAVLDEFVPQHPWAELYREIASVMAVRPLAEDASLLKPDCGGVQQLWRAAAKTLDENADGAVEDATATTEMLEAQPRKVREFLAASLGQAAAEAGSWEFARRMEAMAERSRSSSYGPSGRALLLSARLDAWHDRDGDALQKLRDARTIPGAVGEDALLRLADAALSKSDFAAMDTSHLQKDLAILAREDRGGHRGARAFELWVKLRDHAKGRDAALAILDSGVARGLFPADRRADLLAEIADGSDFADASRPLALVYLEGPDQFQDAMQKPGFRRALAASMVEMGVPSLAEDVLEDQDWRDSGIGLELARAHMDGQEPDKAEDVLRRVPESTARNELMAQALMAKGQLAEAQEYLSDGSPKSADIAEQLMPLDATINAALSSGDTEMALDVGVQRLAVEANADLAEQLAIAALDAGHAKLPEGLKPALSKDRLEVLQSLFRRTADPGEITDLAELNNFIDQLSAEISTIEDLLTDG